MEWQLFWKEPVNYMAYLCMGTCSEGGWMTSLLRMPEEASLRRKLVEVMEFQLSYFKSWKMMLWKCCTQYVSKFRKLSSGHRTGKGQFSSSQRKAMPKNAQTTIQLHSSHTLAKWCWKFSKPGFNSTWTVKFWMFKLDLGKGEEPEIKWSTSAGSLKKQESLEKHLLLLYWLCQSLWLCGPQQTV